VGVRGTATAASRPHEIATVPGTGGIRPMLDSAGNPPINVFDTGLRFTYGRVP